MKLLILSMFLGAFVHSSSGCDDGIIKKFPAESRVKSKDYGTIQYYLVASSSLFEGKDSATNTFKGQTTNKERSSELIACKDGKVQNTYELTYTAEDSNVVTITGWVGKTSKLLTYAVRCGTGQLLNYQCEPNKPNSGVFGIITNTKKAVAKKDLDSCTNALKGMKADEPLTFLDVDKCEK